jgi:hypothetical protein
MTGPHLLGATTTWDLRVGPVWRGGSSGESTIVAASKERAREGEREGGRESERGRDTAGSSNNNDGSSSPWSDDDVGPSRRARLAGGSSGESTIVTASREREKEKGRERRREREREREGEGEIQVCRRKQSKQQAHSPTELSDPEHCWFVVQSLVRPVTLRQVTLS